MKQSDYKLLDFRQFITFAYLRFNCGFNNPPVELIKRRTNRWRDIFSEWKRGNSDYHQIIIQYLPIGYSGVC